MTQINRTTLGKLNYRYDPAGNITAIGTQSYGYDALDRLTSAPSRSYSYDANGNRTQDAGQNYILAPDSNRLMQGAGRVYDYDANGNPVSDGRYSTAYDGQNRLSTVQQGATVQVRSTYNALGQRVRKESPAGITHYLYSTEDQLLAELDAQGNTQREYLYLQSWPVAVVSYTPAVPAGSGTAALLVGDAAAETAEDYPEVAETAPTDPKPTTSTGVTTSGASDRAADGVAVSTATTPSVQLHYLHPDHLGTPRLATDSAQRVVWRWDSAPFGDTPALEDPDGDGVRFTLNLRFPGQYFDAETGLHYNYFRDYDPVVGRYLESDPIGLRGGVNTYGYVENDPLGKSDPDGLNPGSAARIISIGIIAYRACMKIPACKKAVDEAADACKEIECVFARHKRHHKFDSLDQLFCEHYSLRCYFKGVRGGLIWEGQWPFPGKCTKEKSNEWLQ